MFQLSYWTTVTTAELQNQLVYLARRHYPIIEVLRARDADRAAQALHEHIMELIDMLFESKPNGNVSESEGPVDESR